MGQMFSLIPESSRDTLGCFYLNSSTSQSNEFQCMMTREKSREFLTSLTVFLLKLNTAFHLFSILSKGSAKVSNKNRTSNVTAQETTKRTLWDAGVPFLRKTEKNGRPNFRSPPSCGFQRRASTHPLQPPPHGRTEYTYLYTPTGNNPPDMKMWLRHFDWTQALY